MNTLGSWCHSSKAKQMRRSRRAIHQQRNRVTDPVAERWRCKNNWNDVQQARKNEWMKRTWPSRSHSRMAEDYLDLGCDSFPLDPFTLFDGTRLHLLNLSWNPFVCVGHDPVHVVHILTIVVALIIGLQWHVAAPKISEVTRSLCARTGSSTDSSTSTLGGS